MKIVYQHETWLSLNMTNNKMEFGPDGDAVRMSILNDREKGFQKVDPFGLSINRFVLIRYGAITVFLSNNLVVSYVWSYHQRDSRLHLRFNRLHSNFYFYCQSIEATKNGEKINELHFTEEKTAICSICFVP